MLWAICRESIYSHWKLDIRSHPTGRRRSDPSMTRMPPRAASLRASTRFALPTRRSTQLPAQGCRRSPPRRTRHGFRQEREAGRHAAHRPAGAPVNHQEGRAQAVE